MCPTCSAYRFYIVDLQDGMVTGTDDEETANNYCREYFRVIDTWENNYHTGFGPELIKEHK